MMGIKYAAVAVLLSTASAWSFSFSSPIQQHSLTRPKLLITSSSASANAVQTTNLHQHHLSSSLQLTDKSGIKSNSALSSSSSAAAVATTTDDDDDKDPPLFEPFLKGIRRDYKMRLPNYGADITDGLNTQCLAATLFLFFACLAPAIGFGALFGSVTNGAIGTMEMVSSTAMCGFIYAITSAQPLTIIGSTGPVLAFVAALVQLAEKMNLPFLPLYAWTGIWTSGILLAR